MSAPARRIEKAAATGWRGTSSRVRWRWAGVDAFALLALLALVAVAFLPTYGTGWLFVTVLGAGALGMGIGLLATLRRWRSIQVLGAALLGWLVLGTPLVMPSAGIFGILPTGRSLLGLLTGPVTAWRDMLTLDPPIGETANLLAVPGVVALVSGLLGALISLRSRRPMLAWVPAAIGWFAAIVLGSSVAVLPVAAGAAFFMVVLLWTSHRRAHLRASLVGRKTRPRILRASLGAASLLVATGLAVAAMPLLAPTVPRTTARQAVEPPIAIEEFNSPLQGFRANISKNSTAVLLEATGVPDGEIIRVATLDRYDGISFNVSTTDDAAVEGSTFTRVGQWIEDDTEGVDGRARVVIRGEDGQDRGVWVPTVGRTTSIDFDGDRAVALSDSFFYNRSSGTGVTLAHLEPGDTYVLGTRTRSRPGDDEIRAAAAGSHRQPVDVGVPDVLRNRAHQWGDNSGTAGAQALALEAKLAAGWFSNGQPGEATSLPGHTGARLLTLLTDPELMVGDGEQYATAMALMARELGIPARVVYGYRTNGDVLITGADVGAWAEVELQGLGWVMFYPTPDESRTPPEDLAPRPPTPQPQIENPPPPAEKPDKPPLADDLPIDPGQPPEQRVDIDWGQIGVWVALAGIPLVTVVLPLILVLGLKVRRRSRRRHHPDPGNRVAGAWAELVDRARDLGRSPSPAATRTEQAEQLQDDFPRIRPRVDPEAISRQADHLVFAPEQPSGEAVDGYWLQARDVERGLRRSVSWPRWVLAKLSTKSLRRQR
ncbi:MAG: transglutaminaseTgpA domain-containing protein [Arachnia sp.]